MGNQHARKGSSITLLLADDQELVRTGLCLILDTEPDLHVVGQARNGAEAVAMAQDLQPDVVLMDIRMPVLDGIEATRRLPTGVKVIILTTFDADNHVFDAISAGASGFLLKDVVATDLIAAIKVVAAGEASLAPTVTKRLVDRVKSERSPLYAVTPPDGLSSLTEREREVLEQLAQARSNAEIARHLFVSETTVKTHVRRVLAKLNLRDRVQAAVLAYEIGLVRPGRAVTLGRPLPLTTTKSSQRTTE